MAYLEREGGRRLYFEHYPGTKATVLLAHGWGMSGRAWDTVVPALRSAGYGVVSFDQRGCGRSDKDFAKVSISAGAGDVLALLEHLRLDRVVLNGWSLGGAIATAAASALGDRCLGLILTCAATPRYTQADDFPHGNEPGSVAGIIAALAADRATTLRGIAEAVCVKDVGAPVVDWQWGIFLQTAPTADDALAELDDLDQRQILAALHMPVLSIVGGQDVFVAPDIGKLAAKMAPRGQLALFDDCGHAPFLEDNEKYLQVVLDFLDGLKG